MSASLTSWKKATLTLHHTLEVAEEPGCQEPEPSAKFACRRAGSQDEVMPDLGLEEAEEPPELEGRGLQATGIRTKGRKWNCQLFDLEGSGSDAGQEPGLDTKGVCARREVST